jgi:hypothetical protein
MSEMNPDTSSGHLIGAQHKPSEGEPFMNDDSPESQRVASVMRKAYEGWLLRRDIDPTSLAHLELGQTEFLEFSRTGNDSSYTRGTYGIAPDDEYAFVELGLNNPKLVVTDGRDFGTILDWETIAADFQDLSEGPKDPSNPDFLRSALITADIGNTLIESRQKLEHFVQVLMHGETQDPFANGRRDMGVRAGSVYPDQKDAYVWEDSSFRKSIALTISFPKQYDKVCVVAGVKRDPANGKPSMAQIENPEVLLTIEGKNLTELQMLYARLYEQPDFALTDTQRLERDELFNRGLAQLISRRARHNKEAADQSARRRRQQGLLVRHLPL